MLRDVGVQAVQVPWSGNGDDSKYQRFLRVKDGIRDGSIRLPDDPALLSELRNIRGTALPAGGERLEASIGHDDLAHACVQACSIALAQPSSWPTVGHEQEASWDREEREQRERRLMLACYGCG
jgi:hypothetical protein